MAAWKYLKLQTRLTDIMHTRVWPIGEFQISTHYKKSFQIYAVKNILESQLVSFLCWIIKIRLNTIVW